jgi:hypothetical protein
LSDDDLAAAAALFVESDLVTPMVLRVAATLRLPDHLAGGPLDAAALATATDTDPDALDRVLHHLAAVGVLTRHDGTYELTPRGAVLRDDHPSGLRALLDEDRAIGRADLAFVHLLHSVRTGEAGYPRQFGRDFWPDLAADPARTASFDAQMGSDVAAWAPAVVGAFDWSRCGHVVDVGGGNGTLLAALLTAYPSLRGTVFDQPATVDAAIATLRAAGVGDRADVVAGSFFDEDAIPAGAGAYLLCAVLHDWDDESAAAILRRCAAAAGDAGRVVVVEKTGAEGAEPSTAMNLRVLVYFGGRERDVDAIVDLAAPTGLTLADVHRAADISVLTFRPS